MNERKSLWFRSAVFRWFVLMVLYSVSLVFSIFEVDYARRRGTENDLTLWSVVAVVFIYLIPLTTLFIWRRPVWRTVKRVWGLVGWLDKKAEEG